MREIVAIPSTWKQPRWDLFKLWSSYSSCVLLTLRKAGRRKIYAFETWCLRRIHGIQWTVQRTNTSVDEELKIPVSLSSVRLTRMTTWRDAWFQETCKEVESVAGGEWNGSTRYSKQPITNFYNAVRRAEKRIQPKNFINYVKNYGPQQEEATRWGGSGGETGPERRRF